MTGAIDPGDAPDAKLGVDSAYAWTRLVAALLLSTIGGVGMWSVVVVLPPVQAEFAAARSDVSLPYTLTMIGYGLGGLLMGRLADRFGILVPVMIGTIVLAGGYACAGLSAHLWQFTLAQGLLTDKYLAGIPQDARINRPGGDSLKRDMLSAENLSRVRALNEIAARRGQSLAQMAYAWVLRDPRVTTTLIGASSPAQVRENVGALAKLDFSAEELAEIDRHAVEGDVNLWEKPSTDQRV